MRHVIHVTNKLQPHCISYVTFDALRGTCGSKKPSFFGQCVLYANDIKVGPRIDPCETPMCNMHWLNSRGPYGQNIHFSASRFMAKILLWHDSKICGQPKSTSKNYSFRPTSHVLCMCVFLILNFKKSKTNGANISILHHLKEVDVLHFVWKKSAETDKSCQSCSN